MMLKKKSYRILTINPGSTSIKIGLFRNTEPESLHTIEHPPEDLTSFQSTWDQFEYRLRAVTEFLTRHLDADAHIDAVVGRGGLLRPVSGGVFAINEQMLEDARQGYQGDHPANLGCALAHALAQEYEAEAYVVDPVSTNEMSEIARVSGNPNIQRQSLSHALNLHYVARHTAAHLRKSLAASCFVGAHLGGGISIAAVSEGRIIDVNDANNEGPFSVSRSGSLPPFSLARWILQSGFTLEQVKRELHKNSGLQGYLHTMDGREIERRIQEGDEQASFIVGAMAYQIGKEIAAMSSVLKGNVDRIIITGGLAHFQLLITLIAEQVDWIAPLHVMAGEYELQAMAEGAYRVLGGEEELCTYPPSGGGP